MNILISDFITGILIFVRILSLFLVAPFFNNESFPTFIKAITALAITYIIFMIIPRVDVPSNISFIWLFFMGLKEVLTGVIMGFTLELIFYGISFAGFLLSHEIGLMMADMFDPNSQTSENVLGVLLVFMGSVIFVIIGGHRFIIFFILVIIEFVVIVKGDAVAWLIITSINIFGGFIIGVWQDGMDIISALQTYTILTIGDGLVSQIPALLISVASGIIVTKNAEGNALDKQIKMQLMGNARVLGVVTSSILLVAIIPGMPTIPFLFLGSISGFATFFLSKKKKEEELKIQEIEETVDTEPK